MTPSLERAVWAIEGLPTIEEVEKIYNFAADHLRARKALAGRSDADELEMRHTCPAPPPEEP